MRGQSKMKGMKLGRTIAAERERIQSDSERMQARKKSHRRKMTSVIMVLLMITILGLMLYLGVKEMTEEINAPSDSDQTALKIKAQIVDEDRRGQISSRTLNYIAQLEQDLSDLGLEIIKVTLPTGLSRALYVDLAGREGYFKVNLDRGTGVTAEDMARMIKYVDEKELHPEYIDVRVDGRAYYK